MVLIDLQRLILTCIQWRPSQDVKGWAIELFQVGMKIDRNRVQAARALELHHGFQIRSDGDSLLGAHEVGRAGDWRNQPQLDDEGCVRLINLDVSGGPSWFFEQGRDVVEQHDLALKGRMVRAGPYQILPSGG